MTIFLYNSLSHEVEEFKPIKPNQVSIYTCGPTVYDSSHIGHARGMIVWDMIVRYFKYSNYTVQWARNITDIDDKIINRALEENITPDQLARRETYKFWHDLHRLNISIPELEPRATESLQDMFAFIQGLIDKGVAYKSESNDIYFDVQKFPNYGQLKNLNNQEFNISRIVHEHGKQSQQDFTLWKAFPDHPIAFDSPWGRGRPGWHLECSTMIKKHFGTTIDIHGGGEDLIFPHHENEITQSEALHDCKFVNYWMHNGMIMVDNTKMAKSKNNFITINESLQNYSGNAIRLFVLGTHYRQQLNYTNDGLKAAQTAVNKLLKVALKPDNSNIQHPLIDEFKQCMNQDFNTPQALALLHQLAKTNTTESCQALGYLLNILGFDLSDNALNNLHNQNSASNTEELKPIFDLLLDIRQQARESKNYQLSDQIRDKLQESGFAIQDNTDHSVIVKN